MSPPQPPSPVPEGSEEGSSPRGSVSDNGNVNNVDFSNVGTWRVYLFRFANILFMIGALLT